MSVLRLQSKIIYGPILSRRLGRSLGINLLPLDKKLCSFNCIYCQYGYTGLLTTDPDSSLFPSVDEVLGSIERALKRPHTLDHVTFSGNGEPTLHPDFNTIVKETTKLRYRLKPQAKTAVLSNASMISKPEIVEAYNLLDKPILKLDSGSKETFQAVNLPVKGVDLKEIIAGMRIVEGLVVQTALFAGELSNSSPEKIEELINVLRIVKPIEVQLYSTERPVADGRVVKLNASELEHIAAQIQKATGLFVNAFSVDG